MKFDNLLEALTLFNALKGIYSGQELQNIKKEISTYIISSHNAEVVANRDKAIKIIDEPTPFTPFTVRIETREQLVKLTNALNKVDIGINDGELFWLRGELNKRVRETND